MIIAICIVNGIRLQNPSPKYLMRSWIVDPKNRPHTNTMMRAASANTKESGNHRSDQSARAIPTPANLPTKFPRGAADWLWSGFGIVCSSMALVRRYAQGIRTRYAMETGHLMLEGRNGIYGRPCSSVNG